MSHVTEKLAEFIFEELPESQMAEAKRHLQDCANCREQVDRFQQTLSMIKADPDLEPPRNIVFEFEKPVRSRFWRWFPAATAVAALLLLTVALATGVQVHWQDSQLTIAFGETTTTTPDATPTADVASDIQNMKASLALLERRQEAVERDTLVIATRIPPITRGQRSPEGD